MMQFSIEIWLIIVIFIHFRDIYACSNPVGRAKVKYGSIQCKRLSFGQKLKTSCFEDVHRNGVLLNDTNQQVFGITSVADYGVYRCCTRGGVVNYFVLPEDCNGKSRQPRNHNDL